MIKERITLFHPDEIYDLYAPPQLTSKEQERYFAFTDCDWQMIEQLHNANSKLYVMLLLGYFRTKGYLGTFSTYPSLADIHYLLDHYFVDSLSQHSYQIPDRRQRHRLQQRIIRHEHFQPYNQQTKYTTKKALTKAAQRTPQARQLAKLTLDIFSGKKIVLPAYSRMQRLITQIMTQERQRLNKLLKRHLPKKIIIAIRELLRSDDQTLNQLTHIKKDMKSFRHQDVKQELNKQRLLAPLYQVASQLLPKLKLSNDAISYYGSLVTFYTPSKLRRMSPRQSQLYLLCYIYSRQHTIHDHLIQSFEHYINRYHAEGRAKSKEAVYQTKLEAKKLLSKVSDVLDVLLDTRLSDQTPFQKIKARIFRRLPRKEIQLAQQYLKGQLFNEIPLYWEYIDSLHPKIRKNLRPLFLAIDFEQHNKPLGKSMAALKILFQQNKQKKLITDNKTMTNIIPKSLCQHLIVEQDGSCQIKLARFEFYLYRQVYQGIRSGKLTLTASIGYKRLEDELISLGRWKKEKKKLSRELNLPMQKHPAKKWLADFREQLDELYVSVNQRITSSENQHVNVRKKDSKTRWSLPYPKRDELANHDFFQSVPPTDIVDVLQFTQDQCDFLENFTPVQPRYTKFQRPNQPLLATILANAIRLGTYKMGQISDMNYQSMKTTEKMYLRPETLRSAITTIQHATAELPIFSHWHIQGKLHGSLDGSKIGTQYQTARSRYSSKYFGRTRGVVSHNMTANHLPINARIIGANEHESHFFFDLIHNNPTNLKPERCSGDGHSDNRLNFTFLKIIDNLYAPHLPRIQHQRLYSFAPPNQFADLLIHPHEQLQQSLIIKEWDNLQRIFASVLAGNTQQHLLVKKFSRMEYYHPTKAALWQYDHILRSLYILNYIDDPILRQAVRQSLNRGEAYHQLCRTIAYIGGGRFRGMSEMEIDIWNDCARLVASAILYYNGSIISAVFEQLETDAAKEELAQISPAAWRHLNLIGHYEFSKQQKIDIQKIAHSLKKTT